MSLTLPADRSSLRAMNTEIADLTGSIGQPVILRGWIHKFRSSGKIAFLVVRDGTGMVQVVCARNDLGDEAWEAVASLDYEASVEVSGEVKEDARSPGGVEVLASDVRVIGSSTDYPIQPKEHGIDFLRGCSAPDRCHRTLSGKYAG